MDHTQSNGSGRIIAKTGAGRKGASTIDSEHLFVTPCYDIAVYGIIGGVSTHLPRLREALDYEFPLPFCLRCNRRYRDRLFRAA
jgi:hypothetical protein